MLTFEQNIQRRYIKRFCDRNSSLKVQISVTDSCENTCRHCYNGNKKNGHMSEEIFDRVIQLFNKKALQQGVPLQIMFIGGNPFLSPHLKKFALKVYKMGCSYSIKGNPPRKEDRKLLKDLKKFGLTEIQLSIDGRKFHDNLRGKGSFLKTIIAFYRIRRMGIRVVAKMTVFDENINELLEISRLLIKLKVNSIRFARNCNLGSAINEKYIQISPTKYRAFLKEMIDLFKSNEGAYTQLELNEHLLVPVFSELGIMDFNSFDPIINNKEEGLFFDGCSMFGNVYSVDISGNIFLCPKVPKSFLGNIGDKNILEKIEKRGQLQILKIENYINCIKCDLKRYCLGCPATSQSDKMIIDPQCWRNK